MVNKLVDKFKHFLNVQRLRRKVLEIHTNDRNELARRERVRKAFQNGDFKR